MLKRKYRGKILKYGDDINTDEIIPSRFATISLEGKNSQVYAEYAMSDLDPDFINKIKKANILVVGKNFGCGSSRENAVTVLKMSGVDAIVGESFAYIYYRNSINNVLPLIVCNDINKIKEGDEIEIDLDKNKIVNLSNGKTIDIEPIPKLALEIMDQGGIVNYAKNVLLPKLVEKDSKC